MLLRRVVCGGWILVATWGAGPAWGQRDTQVPPVAPVGELPDVTLGGAAEGVVVEGVVVEGVVVEGDAGVVFQVIEAGALPAGVQVRGVVQVVQEAAEQTVADQAAEGAVARPPDPDAEIRQKMVEKLRQRIDVRFNNMDLKSVLDELAQAHGFEYRFDPAALDQTGVKPERAQVGLNVRRQPLVGVLREILQGHGLQFGLEGAVVVIVAQPKLPEGVRRKKARASAPIERVVMGNVLVSDDREEEPAAKPVTIPMEMPPPGVNANQRKQVRDQQFESFKQMFGAQWRSEVATCLGLAEFTPPQKQEIRTAAQQAFDKLGGEWADGQVGQMFGGARNGNAENRAPDVRGVVQQAILKVLQDSPTPERAALYERESTLRSAHRQRATVRNLVSQVDRQVTLSQRQRDELEALLTKEWQPHWVRALEFLQWDGNNVFPNLPAGSVEKLLTEPQAKIWQGLQRIDLNNIWGGGFNFFNQQQPPVEDDDAASGGAEQVPGDVQIQVVPAVDDVRFEVQPEER